jgi:hypothetical protein
MPSLFLSSKKKLDYIAGRDMNMNNLQNIGGLYLWIQVEEAILIETC